MASNKKPVFIGLTVMAIALVFALTSKVQAEVMPMWARWVGGALFIGLIAFYLLKTKAGQSTTSDYQAGAKQTKEEILAEAYRMKAQAEKMLKAGEAGAQALYDKAMGLIQAYEKKE